MDEHAEKNLKRFEELAERARRSCVYTYSSFHSTETASLAYRVASENEVTMWGGTDNSERVVVRFGDPKELGYEEDFPIDILAIVPLVDKFADDLTHRDFLGALMSLGIERSLLGDIIVTGKKAYIFCLERISDFIIENLVSVKHTSVSVRKAEAEDVRDIPKGFEKEKMIQVASERIDAVIAKVYNISRSAAMEYFAQKKVFVNGRQTENTSLALKQDDVVTVRGYGRFKLAEIVGTSRKGKLNILVRL